MYYRDYELSPLLFNILLEVVTAVALEENEIGAIISGNIISTLQFADGIWLLARSNAFLHHLLPGTQSPFTATQYIGKQQMKITVDNCELEEQTEFVYLGGIISQEKTRDRNVERRIGLAAGTVRSLHKIWKSEDISKQTKVLLYHYQTLVQSIVLYNCETWALKKHNKRVFEITVLKKISVVARKDTKGIWI